jgi:hypothetical protein
LEIKIMRVLSNLEMTSVSGGDRWCDEVAQYDVGGEYGGGMASNGYTGGGDWIWRDTSEPQTVNIIGDRPEVTQTETEVITPATFSITGSLTANSPGVSITVNSGSTVITRTRTVTDKPGNRSTRGMLP